MEDYLQCKTTLDGRRPLMEDDLPWKKTFDGRQPLMEDDLQWMMTFDGRQPLMKDDLQWKMTFDGTKLGQEKSPLALLFLPLIALFPGKMPFNVEYRNLVW